MTYRQHIERRIGKEAFRRLPARWKRHVQRIDDLPKPVKKISARRLREIFDGL